MKHSTLQTQILNPILQMPHPISYTLHPPHTPHPTPYTLHPTPYTLHPTPTPYTLHLASLWHAAATSLANKRKKIKQNKINNKNKQQK